MNFKTLTIKLQNLIHELEDKALYSEIGQDVSKNVKDRTRSGFGVEDNGAKAVKLKALKSSYKKERRRLRKTGKLSSDTSPAKSNLTKTGEMVDSVTYTADPKSVNIYIKGPKNKEKAKYQVNEGRSFMNLSKREIQDITDIIEEKLKKDIRKKGL